MGDRDRFDRVGPLALVAEESSGHAIVEDPVCDRLRARRRRGAESGMDEWWRTLRAMPSSLCL